MHRRAFIIVTMIVFVTACGRATATPSLEATQTSLPSATVQPTALPSGTPTKSPTPENTTTPTATPSLEPTLTETMAPDATFSPEPILTATSLPQPVVGSAAIQFYAPGPLSKAVSPMVVSGYAIPGYGAKGTVFLFGEDGRLMVSKLLQLNTAFTWAYYYGTLTFEVQGAGELGRLTMVTQDVYGRTTAENSVHLVLLPEGNAIINAPGNVKERCAIEQPATGKRISGGTMTIGGNIRPYNSLPLEVSLIGRDGQVIASQGMSITPAADDSYVPFTVDLHYSISRGAWALMTVSQDDDRIAGTMYLSSREIYLNP